MYGETISQESDLIVLAHCMKRWIHQYCILCTNTERSFVQIDKLTEGIAHRIRKKLLELRDVIAERKALPMKYNVAISNYVEYNYSETNTVDLAEINTIKRQIELSESRFLLLNQELEATRTELQQWVTTGKSCSLFSLSLSIYI